MDLFKPFKDLADAFLPGKTKPKAADLQQRQTDQPRSEWLNREVAAHPGSGLTPARLAAIFQEAEQGNIRAQAELYMDMREKDAHIDAEMSKRIMAVKKLDWRLDPPRNPSATEKKATKNLEFLIRDQIDIADVKADMLDAIGHGYSCLELGWAQTDQNLWYPNIIEHREPDWFVCPLYDRNTLHLRSVDSAYGDPLQPFGWIPHIHKSRSGYIPRAGLFRSLAWPYLYKNWSVRDLAEFLEIYGLPIRVGKYNPNATPSEKMDLLRTVLSIGHNAAGIIPDTMQLELQSVVASGGADNFQAMINWAEEKVSMAILGGTLTSKPGANGNRSLGDVHNDVRMDIRDDDSKQVDYSLSKFLIYPMAILNGMFANNRTPTCVSDTQDPEDIEIFGNAIPKLVTAGAKIPVNYINEKLKIPVPAPGDEILTMLTRTENITTDNEDIPNTQAAAKATAKLTALLLDAKASATAALSTQSTQQPYVDPTPNTAQTDQLAREAGPAINKMVNHIRDIVNKADSLEDLQTALLNAYGHLDNTELQKIMTYAFAGADLAGQFDVKNEEN